MAIFPNRQSVAAAEAAMIEDKIKKLIEAHEKRRAADTDPYGGGARGVAHGVHSGYVNVGISGGGGGGGVSAGVGAGMVNSAYEPAETILTASGRTRMIASRLRISVRELTEKLAGIGTSYVEGDEKVYTHFVGAGELVVFPDDAHMFPSDSLVTSLRLCIK